MKGTWLAVALIAAAPLAQAAGPVAASIALDAPMGEALARGMLGRFGYGATLADIQRVARQSPRAYVEEGIRGASVLPETVAVRVAALPVSAPLQPVWESYGAGSGARVGLRDDPERRKA